MPSSNVEVQTMQACCPWWKRSSASLRSSSDTELWCTKTSLPVPRIRSAIASVRALVWQKNKLFFPAAFSAAEPRPSFAFLTASGDSPLDQGLVLIRSETAVEVKLAAVTAATAERQLELRNLGKGTAKLGVPLSTGIGGSTTYSLAPGGRITLRSDGAGKNWRIIASIEGRS